MSNRRNPTPAYRLHKRSGKGIVDVYRHDGKRTSLVMPGAYRSPESLAEHARILALLATNNGRLPPAPGELTTSGGITIAQLTLRFFDEKVAKSYVDADGQPTTEQGCFKQSLKPLTRLYGSTPVAAFDSDALARVQDAMISGSWMSEEERQDMAKRGRRVGRGRTTVNKAISRIRMMFRWGNVRKLVSAELITNLDCLLFLKPGEGGAREHEPVEPVPLEVVETTIPHLPPVVADIVRILQLTGARCGEICSMHMGDIDRSKDVWTYRPRRHKNKKRGHKRIIYFGPQAQAILAQYLKANPDAYIFSPREQKERIDEIKRANRKSKVQPSQVDRSRPDAPRKPGERFQVTGIGRTIRRACKRAGIAHWHPHQLRHLFAETISREHSTEAARISLGHKTASMTVRYAGADPAFAAALALKVG